MILSPWNFSQGTDDSRQDREDNMETQISGSFVWLGQLPQEDMNIQAQCILFRYNQPSSYALLYCPVPTLFRFHLDSPSKRNCLSSYILLFTLSDCCLHFHMAYLTMLWPSRTPLTWAPESGVYSPENHQIFFKQLSLQTFCSPHIWGTGTEILRSLFGLSGLCVLYKQVFHVLPNLLVCSHSIT